MASTHPSPSLNPITISHSALEHCLAYVYEKHGLRSACTTTDSAYSSESSASSETTNPIQAVMLEHQNSLPSPCLRFLDSSNPLSTLNGHRHGYSDQDIHTLPREIVAPAFKTIDPLLHVVNRQPRCHATQNADHMQLVRIEVNSNRTLAWSTAPSTCSVAD